MQLAPNAGGYHGPDRKSQRAFVNTADQGLPRSLLGQAECLAAWLLLVEMLVIGKIGIL